MKSFEVTKLYVSELNDDISYGSAQFNVNEDNTSKWNIEIQDPEHMNFLKNAARNNEELQIVFSVIGKDGMQAVARVISVQRKERYVTLGGISQTRK
ncbi:hypothetical protein N7X28_28935 [Bacillus sp. SM-B1]|uniref:hypothetical protein n=1 Tax=Bacillus sp. SM-B1 TaxID=2980102 RepID=UPI002949F269|nr:hypothetical protein [Bacillus sp. SM-B1]MDV6040447.1 hypothetical protein [Bacillus sp. SM-B1]